MKYYFIQVANSSYWCIYDAACLPGAEDDLQAAILADVQDSQSYEIDSALRLYDECREEDESLEDYRARVTKEMTYRIDIFEEYLPDEDGTPDCPSHCGRYHWGSFEDAEKELPLDDKAFAFIARDSGRNG